MAKMTPSSQDSRLLALYEALQQVSIDQLDPLPQISTELYQALEIYISGLLSDQTQDSDEELDRLLLAEPAGFAVLKSMLDQAAAVDDLGPVPQEILEEQLQKLVQRSEKPVQKSRQTAAVTVMRRQGGLEYAGTEPRRVLRSFDMARNASEAVQRLQFEQTLESCELRVSIELGSRQTFTVFLEITFLVPTFKKASLEIRASDLTGVIVKTQPIIDATAEFEELPPGNYAFEVAAEDATLGKLYLELRSEGKSSFD